MTIKKQFSTLNDAPFILLVEDNPVALRFVESIVSQSGCRFVSAVDGEKALELAKTVNFDLIITDIGLPGISGIELTRLIREWESSLNKPFIPIIGLTAHSFSESEKKCLKGGMNKVISKPIYLHQMQDLILEYIQATKS